MDIYYKKRLKTEPVQSPLTPIDVDGVRIPAKIPSSEYGRYCQSLLQTDDGEGPGRLVFRIETELKR
jgi:hypothetical protein